MKKVNFKFYKKRKNKIDTGFTLIELLIVIAVIAVLAALTFVALDPVARFQDSRNTQRWADVNAILSAIKLSQIDNNGSYIDEIENYESDVYWQIGYDEEGCGEGVSCLNPTVALEDSACIDLTALVASGYLADVPIDPNCDGASAGATRYYFIKHATGSMITIGSCCEEQGSNSSIPDISITK